MRMKDRVQEVKNKRNKNRRMKEIRMKVMRVLIGYPIIFPLIKMKEIYRHKRELFWLKRLDKLRKKSIDEAIKYIINEFSYYSVYFIYNVSYTEDLDYGNAFYVHSFFRKSFLKYHAKKDNPISSFYGDLVTKKTEGYKEEDFYTNLYNELKEELTKRYEDIEIEDVIEEVWGRYYTGFIIRYK